MGALPYNFLRGCPTKQQIWSWNSVVAMPRSKRSKAASARLENQARESLNGRFVSLKYDDIIGSLLSDMTMEVEERLLNDPDVSPAELMARKENDERLPTMSEADCVQYDEDM